MNAFKLSLSEIDKIDNPGITGYSRKHKYYMCTTIEFQTQYSNILLYTNHRF